MLLDLPDQDPLVRVSTNPDPSSSSKIGKKTHDSNWFVTSLWLISLKNYASVASKNNTQINSEKKFFFVAILKDTDENSRIR